MNHSVDIGLEETPEGWKAFIPKRLWNIFFSGFSKHAELMPFSCD